MAKKIQVRRKFLAVRRDLELYKACFIDMHDLWITVFLDDNTLLTNPDFDKFRKVMKQANHLVNKKYRDRLYEHWMDYWGIN
jgi:hypothetical protein